jgi:hypothetical protein
MCRVRVLGADVVSKGLVVGLEPGFIGDASFERIFMYNRLKALTGWDAA